MFVMQYTDIYLRHLCKEYALSYTHAEETRGWNALISRQELAAWIALV